MTKRDQVSPTERERKDHRTWTDRLASLRYLIIRAIGYPVPFLPSWIPILGGRTFIELVMIFVACYVSIPQALSDFEEAGVVADYLMTLTILFGFRNNAVTYLLGMSFERVLYWHKMIAVLTVVVTIIHAFEGWGNPSGLLIFATMGVMGLSYFIKPYVFEAFYYVHVIGVILLIPFGLMHYSKIYQYVCLVWFVDILLRYVVTMRKISTVATLLPGDVVRIKFDHCFKYSCGQYCFLMIKEISPFDFHPMSLSSSPEDGTTTFHIRELGGWSRNLAKFIREEHQRQLDRNPNLNANDPSISIPLDVFVEGPYGNKMIDVESPDYEVFLLISGGIGITPLQSVYNHLLHQSSSGRKLRKVIFIWSVKDRAIVDALYTDKLHSDIEIHKQHTPYLPISFQPSMPPPPICLSNQGDDNVHGNGTRPFEIHGTSQSISPEGESVGDITIIGTQQDLNSQFIFYNEYYLTQIRPTDQQHTAGIHPEVQKWLKFGRPQIKEIFTNVADLCKAENIPRVAVCVCGPTSMVNEVADLCRLSKIGPHCGTVRFDCHQEVFDF